MKNFKKIVSLVLAVCLMASLAIGASAANTVEILWDKRLEGMRNKAARKAMEKIRRISCRPTKSVIG